MNGYIRAPEVRVVAPDGEQIGVKKLAEALWLAEQLDLDLVEVSLVAKPMQRLARVHAVEGGR